MLQDQNSFIFDTSLMEKALILHSHASASELIHFQYNSFRKALILNSLSASELNISQWISQRKAITPEAQN